MCTCSSHLVTVDDHIVQDGLFSHRGRQSEIADIMNMLDTGGKDLPGSVFSVASILITFLAALAEPVVPVVLHGRCMECCNNTTLCKQVGVFLCVRACMCLCVSVCLCVSLCESVCAGVCE